MELLKLLQLALPTLLKGIGYTLLFAVSSMLSGLLLGFPLVATRHLPSRLCQWLASVYVSLIRGTPLLVQIFVIYYGLPSAGINFSPLMAGILALSLNASAYLSESLRGAIVGVNKGQWAASYSICAIIIMHHRPYASPCHP